MSDNGSGQPAAPKPGAGSNWRWWAAGVPIAVVAGLGFWYFFPFGISASKTETPTLTARNLPRQTEAVFASHVNAHVKKSGYVHFLFETSSGDLDVLPEWRAARSDHKVIADAIANCPDFIENIAPDDIDTMPRYAFSALLLDLRPDGAHQFDKADSEVGSNNRTGPKATAAASGHAAGGSNSPSGTESAAQSDRDEQGGSEAAKGQETVTPGEARKHPPIKLTAYQQAVLTLSDAIARGRLAAASAAADNIAPMRLLGWMTVLLSALATLFVTIKSSMTAPPPKSDPPPKASGAWWLSGPWSWVTSDHRPHRFSFYSIGILAMVFSALVTALTGYKQFYDPTTAYKGSEIALMQLRRLHTQVVRDFLSTWDGTTMCAEGKPQDENWKKQNGLKEQLTQWTPVLGNYQAAVVAASANLQDADLAWMTKTVKGWPPLLQDAAIPSVAAKPAEAGAAAGNTPAASSTVPAHKGGKK